MLARVSKGDTELVRWHYVALLVFEKRMCFHDPNGGLTCQARLRLPSAFTTWLL